MKDRAIHYLGLDVHQATVVATSRNESGAIVLKATVPTEAKAIVGLVRGQGPDMSDLVKITLLVFAP